MIFRLSLPANDFRFIFINNTNCEINIKGMKKLVILHMHKIYLPAYHNFECLAGECPDNCCGIFRILFFDWEKRQFPLKSEWQDVDGKRTPLTKHLTETECECTISKDSHGRCPFFTDVSLCSLQLKYGIEALPSVCRTYPRLITRFPDRTEYALDTCCCHVLQLIRDWNPGELEIVGEDVPSDDAWLVRKRAMELFADSSQDLDNILEEIGRLYEFHWDKQGLSFDENQQEFLRKAIPATIWAYALPYYGHHNHPKPMTAIMEFLAEYLGHLSGSQINRWEELSINFSRSFSEFVKRIKFDDEIENRYIDLLND